MLPCAPLTPPLTPPLTSFSAMSLRAGESKSAHFLPAISKYATRICSAPFNGFGPLGSPRNSACMAVFSRCSMVCVFPEPVCPYMNSAPTPPASAPRTMGAAAVS